MCDGCPEMHSSEVLVSIYSVACWTRPWTIFILKLSILPLWKHRQKWDNFVWQFKSETCGWCFGDRSSYYICMLLEKVFTWGSSKFSYFLYVFQVSNTKFLMCWLVSWQLDTADSCGCWLTMLSFCIVLPVNGWADASAESTADKICAWSPGLGPLVCIKFYCCRWQVHKYMYVYTCAKTHLQRYTFFIIFYKHCDSTFLYFFIYKHCGSIKNIQYSNIL